MPEKLETLPHPAVELEAWERLWKACPRSWKQVLRRFVQKMARGTEEYCYNARPGMCVAISDCTAGAKT